MEDSRLLVGSALTGDRLDLILFATEKCNFRCTYCYEEFEHGRMVKPVADGVKNLMSVRAPGLDQMTVAWFGGEPLIEMPLIRDVMRHAGQLSVEHPGLQVSASITTNGWLLTRPLFEELLGLGVVTYQVTLDGPPAWHNRRRRLASGGGTFQRIWDHLLALREVEGDFTIYIRIHVDEQNVSAIKGFIGDCAPAFGGDKRFQPHFHPLIKGGKSPEEDVCPLTGEKGRTIVRMLDDLALDQGLNIVGEEAAPKICYAATANSFIIRADGRVGKCSIALEHPANQLGRINQDGTLDISVHQLLPWLRGLAGNDQAALKCPMDGIPAPPRTDTEKATQSAEFIRGLKTIFPGDGDVSL